MRRLFLCLVPVLALLAATPSRSAGPEGKMSPALASALRDSRAATVHHVWVFFKDKGPGLEASTTIATPRALSRRAARGRARAEGDLTDRALAPTYVRSIAERVSRVRHESRWFNAVSVEATESEVWALEGLPFVARLDLVRRYRSRMELALDAAAAGARGSARPYGLDYGTSVGQLQQINVPAVHSLGLHGEGVVVAVFDAGFNNLAHEALAPLTILARHDFVNGDDDVGDGPDRGEGSHGTMTLSVLGGFKEGQLIGPAFAASFLLAKTEDTESETPVEEDNWAAAAEWAEAMGADVISSSLGYLEFDAPQTSYTYRDMDGRTAVSTRAADLAAERGVVIVNSAGNAGFNPEHNTLGAPADGFRVLAAGAVTSTGQRVGFSSVGPTADGRIKPDVAAQGSLVKVASPTLTNQYRLASGTSFSCPLTAGVAALILAAHPTYTVDQVIAALRNTATNAAMPDNLLGWGIVDALRAVQSEPAL